MRVVEFIDRLEGEQQLLFLLLHDFIMEYPGMQSSIKYKIPFFSIKKPICYLSPQKETGLEIVFWSGRKMGLKHVLDFKKRKHFGGITFHSCQEVELELIANLLKEASELDALDLPFYAK